MFNDHLNFSNNLNDNMATAITQSCNPRLPDIQQITK